MKKLIFIVLISFIFLSFILSTIHAGDIMSVLDSSVRTHKETNIFNQAPEKEIEKIQKAYENITDIKGNFIQKSYIKDLKRTDTYKGQFFIKMPMKVRWMYKGEVAQEVFISNDEILIYQKKEKQAFRGKFDRDTYGQAPIALLSGFGKIQEEFILSRKDNNLFLKPKSSLGGVISIEIKTSGDEFPISSFIISDIHSNRIEIILKDVEINTGLKDTFFKPSFPGDIKIHEYNSWN
ncbi:MAG: LolA family protein [Thermodesulfovibrionales bacterium]